MAKLATEIADNIKVSDIEFKLPQPSYTVDTLAYMKERYPQHQFTLIMGSDNLQSLKKWKNYELLLSDYKILVYPRPGFKELELVSHPSVTITDTPQMEISSTFIRKSVVEGKNVQFFVPEKVLEFIESKNLYR
jgi:nicotinate-nucleotide adenylyltransferase